MKRTKRVLMAAMAAMMVFVFAGCGGQDTNTPEGAFNAGIAAIKKYDANAMEKYLTGATASEIDGAFDEMLSLIHILARTPFNFPLFPMDICGEKQRRCHFLHILSKIVEFYFNHRASPFFNLATILVEVLSLIHIFCRYNRRLFGSVCA